MISDFRIICGLCISRSDATVDTTIGRFVQRVVRALKQSEMVSMVRWGGVLSFTYQHLARLAGAILSEFLQKVLIEVDVDFIIA